MTTRLGVRVNSLVRDMKYSSKTSGLAASAGGADLTWVNDCPKAVPAKPMAKPIAGGAYGGIYLNTNRTSNAVYDLTTNTLSHINYSVWLRQ